MSQHASLKSYRIIFFPDPVLINNYFIVLEIGCYIGFSALGWSEAVGPDGHVTTLEYSPEYAQIARDTFEKNGIKNVEVIVGDANKR